MSVDLDHLTMLHAFAEQESSDEYERFEEFAVAVFEEWDSITEELHDLRRQRYIERLFPIFRLLNPPTTVWELMVPEVRTVALDSAREGLARLHELSGAHVSLARPPNVGEAPAIPFDMLLTHEGQAQANHNLSLRYLADHGGLSECEAVAVLEDRPWAPMPPEEARAKLATLVKAWTEDALRSQVEQLRRELQQARMRLLLIADYTDVDAGEKTLDECISLVELDLDCEYEMRIELEHKLARGEG